MRLSNPQPMSTGTTLLLLTTLLPTALVYGRLFDTLFQIGRPGFDAVMITYPNGTTSPNATHNVPIPGYDVTKPGNTTSPDWSFTIDVKDIPVFFETQDYMTGTMITLNAPKKLLTTNSTWKANDTEGNKIFIQQEKSWSMCAKLWTTTNLQSDAQTVNSNCEGFLSEECLAGLRRMLIRDDDNGCTTLSSDLVPRGCVPQLRDGRTGMPGTFSEENTMPEFIPTTSEGRYTYLLSGDMSNLHEIGNYTSYDNALRQVYVTMLKWSTADFSTTTQVGQKPPRAGSLVCLRAGNNVTLGSRGVEPLKKLESGGVSLAGGLGSSWVVMAMMGGVLLGAC